jgi:hypothetical protein
MIVTQTQTMAEDGITRLETEDTMNGFDPVVLLKDKKLVQMTLFGTVVKKLALKAVKVKVRSHLRRKSEAASVKRKEKVQVKVKGVEKKVAQRKKQRKKIMESHKEPNPTVVNDPGLSDTVQLMEQMKFDDMMELRDRLFQIRLP